MSANTFTLGPDDPIEDDNPDIVVGNNLTAAANPDGTPYTGALVVLVPADDDPVVAASSEPAHITTVWLGEQADLPVDEADLMREVAEYAATLDGPVVVPVSHRGTLGDDGADVVFLEATDSLVALRDGLIEGSPAVGAAYEAAEQFPEWTPHVTLGYPERPARGEYDATEVTFDRISLWLGGEHHDYPMGGTVSNETVTADAAAVIGDVDVDEESGPEDIELVEDVLEDGEEEIVEIPIHGVATIEGRATGDGRMFKRGALAFREPGNGGALPVRLEIVGSHGGDTSHAVPVGRIDEIWRHEAGDIDEIRYRGSIILSAEHAQKAIDGIVTGMLTGVSIESDSIVMDPEHEAAQAEVMNRVLFEDDSEPITEEEKKLMQMSVFSEARVCGFTIVPIPAFQEAYIALGHEFEDEMTEEQLTAAAQILEDCGCGSAPAEELSQAGTEDFAPGTKDGPGWITHPIPTSRIRRYWVRGPGAAKIGWGAPRDFYRCRNQLRKYVQNPDWLSGLCANMHKEATGTWPGQHDRHALRDSLIASGDLKGEPAALVTLTGGPQALVATGGRVYSAEAFTEPSDIGYAHPMMIDRETRRIYGYAAQWGTCHIGVQGACVDPPRSRSDYRYFRKGIVETDAGEQEVALITYGIGHASRLAGAAAATAHYDQTDAVRAYINIGENHRGIWYSGVLAPWVTDDDIDAMLAIRRVSGDWRNWSGRPGDLEMVGLVVVNTEGYQLAASGDMQTAAIGIGAVPVDGAPVEQLGETHEDFVNRVAQSAVAMIERRRRLDAAQAKARKVRLAAARARIERI